MVVKAIWSRCFSLINSTVAVNAHHRKIQALIRILLSVLSHSEHLLLEKNGKMEKKKKRKKNRVHVILIASPRSPFTDSQTIFFLLSPLKTLE